MAQILFENFLAAERKPNMKDFGMFPADRDLSWVASIPRCLCDVVQVTAGATIDLELMQGTTFEVLLTQDVSSFEITLNGSISAFAEGQTLIVRLIEDSHGAWTYPLPSTVLQPAGYEPLTAANTETTWYLQWSGGVWNFLVLPINSDI